MAKNLGKEVPSLWGAPAVLLYVSILLVPGIAGAGEWRPMGLPGVSINTLAVDPSNPRRILAGTGPEGGIGLWKSDDGGETWRHIVAGLPDPHRVNTIAFQPAVSAPGDAVSGDEGTGVVLLGTFNSVRGNPGIYRSTDGGETWQPALSGLERAVYEVTAIVFDPVDPDVVYAAHNDNPGGVSKSLDGGLSWSDASLGLGPDDFCQRGCALDLAIDPGSPSTVYAAMPALADLYKTTNGGDLWFPTNLGFWPERLALAPGAPGTLFASGSTFTLGGGIGRTLDGAENWENLSHQGGLPALLGASHRSVALDPANPNTVWLLIEDFDPIPTDEAVYRSLNGGFGWTRAHEGLEGVEKVYDLTFHGPSLLAATDDGIYRRVEDGLFGSESCRGYRGLEDEPR